MDHRPAFEQRAGGAVAFLSSLVVHVSLLVILALCVFTVGKPSDGVQFTAEIGEAQSVSVDVLPAFEIAPISTAESSLSVASPMEVNLDVALEVPKTATEPAKPASLGDGLATLTSARVGGLAETLDAKGLGRGASFFGSYAEGSRFVYVLDSSRSMQGDRWIYACQQLVDSLQSLKEGQEFFVICFDMKTTFLFNLPLDQVGFLPAGDEVTQRVKRWLRSRSSYLGRATMPAEALQYALQLNPDAIFMLSDGELQDHTVLALQLTNGTQSERRQIPIHTVHLMSAEGRQTLEVIAAQNGGSFRHVE